MDKVVAPFYDASTVKTWDNLLIDLALESPAEIRIDTVVSATCPDSMLSRGKDLQRVYENRQTKFRILCVLHHATDVEFLVDQAKWITREGNLEILALSSQ
jgi:hypothetical protein